jgi:hypothetical protein
MFLKCNWYQSIVAFHFSLSAFRSLKSMSLSNDMGDLAWTLELEVGCLMDDMTDATRGNEIVESSS